MHIIHGCVTGAGFLALSQHGNGSPRNDMGKNGHYLRTTKYNKTQTACLILMMSPSHGKKERHDRPACVIVHVLRVACWRCDGACMVSVYKKHGMFLISLCQWHTNMWRIYAVYTTLPVCYYSGATVNESLYFCIIKAVEGARHRVAPCFLMHT